MQLQQMLGQGPTRQVMTVRGGVADPIDRYAGGNTGMVGAESRIELDGGKIEVAIRYVDRISIVDVYEQPGHLLIHAYCWRCTRMLTIRSQAKQIRWLRGERRLDIEQFRCTHPGCGLHVRVVDNVAKDAS